MIARFRNLSDRTQTLVATLGVVLFMGAMGFAAVPLYDLFCRVTGYGGTTARAAAAPGEVVDRTVTVRFDASLAAGMPWRFRPVGREMQVRLGEVGLAFYEATNPTDAPVAGTASFNVTPFSAGGYFTKIDCFCFTEQVLGPGETVMMPVTFFIDPAILRDADGRFVNHITLSYTFHRTDLPETAALSAAGADAGAVN